MERELNRKQWEKEVALGTEGVSHGMECNYEARAVREWVKGPTLT